MQPRTWLPDPQRGPHTSASSLRTPPGRAEDPGGPADPSEGACPPGLCAVPSLCKRNAFTKCLLFT